MSSQKQRFSSISHFQANLKSILKEILTSTRINALFLYSKLALICALNYKYITLFPHRLIYIPELHIILARHFGLKKIMLGKEFRDPMYDALKLNLKALKVILPDQIYQLLISWIYQFTKEE